MVRRVVVTGLGLVTPLGTGVETSWNSLCEGKSGIGPITRFDPENYAVKIAAEVKDFQVEDYIDKKTAKHLDLFVQYAVASAKMALEDAELEITDNNATRVGCITGCGLGGLSTIEKYHKVLLDKGAKRITPFFIPMVIPNMNAGQISIIFKAKGPNLSVTTACAAGTQVLGEPRWAEAAARAARYVLDHMRQEDGRLYATSEAEHSGAPRTVRVRYTGPTTVEVSRPGSFVEAWPSN